MPDAFDAWVEEFERRMKGKCLMVFPARESSLREMGIKEAVVAQPCEDAK